MFLVDTVRDDAVGDDEIDGVVRQGDVFDIALWNSTLLRPDFLLCDFFPVRLTSSTYGSELVAKVFGRGRQVVDALLAIAVFVGRCTFVDVGLAPAQEPVN
jgi:hypothetical protein